MTELGFKSARSTVGIDLTAQAARTTAVRNRTRSYGICSKAQPMCLSAIGRCAYAEGRLVLVIVIGAVLLGSFDEWAGHQHFVLSRIRTCPTGRRIPSHMVKE